jgi:cysteine desulfurase/selenocysteine lyase
MLVRLPFRFRGDAMFDKSNELFPIKDKYVFLSHCGIAPLYREAMRKEREIAEAQNRTGSLVYGRYEAILDGLREAAAALLATSPENLAFVKNTSEGMGLIANGYRFEPGDQVISYLHEYPANYYPWQLQARRGVELVLLPDRDPAGSAPVAFTMRDLQERITPRTRIVTLSHVQFASGYVADLEVLAEFCQAHKIDLVLDIAQSLGCMPVYPEELGIAATVSSGWKWLMGPMGTGLLYTSEKFRHKLDLVMVGAETMRQGTDYLDHRWNPHSSAKCFEYSTSPISLAAALECSIRAVPLRYGVKAIAAEIFRLQDVFLHVLDRNRFRTVLAPEKEERRSSIVSLVVPGGAKALCRALGKENVVCTERGSYLRFAPHFYNTDEEVERAAGLLNASASP